MTKDKGAFEWQGQRFSTREGLDEILAQGVFKEGEAWGSIRRGWAQTMGWRDVAQALEDAGARLRLWSGARLARDSLPPAALQGNLSKEGERIWVGERFSLAGEKIWARCEAELLQASAKAPKKKATAKKPQPKRL